MILHKSIGVECLFESTGTQKRHLTITHTLESQKLIYFQKQVSLLALNISCVCVCSLIHSQIFIESLSAKTLY